MRYLIVIILTSLCAFTSIRAAVNVGIDIGFHMSAFPTLVLVPGYPVYYDPDASDNYFFYDGRYWVFNDDSWYTSSWYDGPWMWVEPDYVPVFLLRVPIRYYRRPPAYFSLWRVEGPPRWGDHWGPSWQQRHANWEHWDQRAAPRPAPLPIYQQKYAGEHYPHDVVQQQSLHAQNYQYRPREGVAQHEMPNRPRTERPNIPQQPMPERNVPMNNRNIEQGLRKPNEVGHERAPSTQQPHQIAPRSGVQMPPSAPKPDRSQGTNESHDGDRGRDHDRRQDDQKKGREKQDDRR